MGERGPRPTPSSMLRLRGSWRADLNADEPQPTSGAPAKPEDLEPLASAVWDHMAVELSKMRVLTVADGYALEMLCRTWAKWQDAEQSLAKHGSVFPIRNPDGSLKYLQQSPWVSITRQLSDQLLKMLREFGLTPSARTRISTEPAEAADPLQDLLNRRNA